MPLSTEELEARVQLLRDSYATKLPAKLEQMASNIAALTQAWDEECALDTGRLAHNLAGTGETFGFADIGGAARELETHLLAIQDGEFPRTELNQTKKLLDELVAVARQCGVSITPAKT